MTLSIAAILILVTGWILGRLTTHPRPGRPRLNDRDFLQRRTLGFWIR